MITTENTLVPVIPESAPFSAEQRAWLNGLFAGMYSKGSAKATIAAPKRTMTILYGSQTGTAENLAQDLSDTLEEQSYQCKVEELSNFKIAQLKDEKELIILTSTYGDGEAPDNAKEFLTDLASSSQTLENLSYSIFGLGDSNYPKFCQCSKDIDQYLKKLGAQSMTDRIDCDVDYEAPFEDYKIALAQKLGAESTNKTPSKKKPTGYTRSNPYQAALKQSYSLHQAGAEKETIHLEFALDAKDCPYETGDALGVYPINDDLLVNEVLLKITCDGNEQVDYNDNKADLYSVLKNNLNLSKATEKLGQLVAAKTNHLDFKKIAKIPADLKAYLNDRELTEILSLCNEKIGPQEFIATLKKIAPRLYSISSSPEKHLDEVHLTVGTVSYALHGRNRKGLCSNYLKDLTPGDTANVFIHKNKLFRLADVATDVIMIGPGTGIAPFRAFIEERFHRKANGRNWLFFGNPYASTDFFYEQELNEYLDNKHLNKLSLAFSRDQDKKVYVQDRMLEDKKELYQWLKNGAALYVCGDASRMAKDVDQTLHTIFKEEGQMTSDEASASIKELIKNKRYLRDVY